MKIREIDDAERIGLDNKLKNKDGNFRFTSKLSSEYKIKIADLSKMDPRD